MIETIWLERSTIWSFTKNIQQFHEIYSLIHLFIILLVSNSVNDTEECKDEWSYALMPNDLQSNHHLTRQSVACTSKKK